MSTATQLREPLTASAGILVAVALALFAAMRVGGENRYGTMGERLLATPRRARLLLATLSVHGLLGLFVGALALGIGLAVGVLAHARGRGPEHGHDAADRRRGPLRRRRVQPDRRLLRVIFRSQSAAVMVIVGTFVAEKVVGMFIGNAAAYLPYGLLTPLLRLEGATISQGAAAITLAVTTLALVALATRLFTRRDVTS